jgi:hypothetical protein
MLRLLASTNYPTEGSEFWRPQHKDSSAMNHARISEAFRALVFEPEPGVELHEVLDRYYAHRSDGRTMNRDEFTKMVTRIRGQVTEGSGQDADPLGGHREAVPLAAVRTILKASRALQIMRRTAAYLRCGGQ